MNDQAKYGTQPDRLQPRYATPPKKEWVGLTDVEKEHICGKHMHMSAIGFVNFIEAKLKEKNA